MAFRKKADVILQHQPDIVVVQECEHPDKLLFNPGTAKPTDYLWFGKNNNKGLGIFSYSGFKLKLHRSYNEAFKWVVPINVSSDTDNFILYAVWANNPDDPDGQYVTQVWKALNHYRKHIKKKNTNLTSDFNGNSIWDRPRRQGNHSHVVDALAAKKYTVLIIGILHKSREKKMTLPFIYTRIKTNRTILITVLFPVILWKGWPPSK